MHLDHFALYTTDLERLRAFYETYFGAQAGPRYTNPQRGFTSYFLAFATGARLELMQLPTLAPAPAAAPPPVGYHHLAINVGSRTAVDELTARLQQAGVPLLSPPRQTGDGYYESVIADPDGNAVEITAG